MAFEKARKGKAKLKMALEGLAGSGKTFSALSIATGLGASIGLIDTEAGTSAKYADRFDFGLEILENYSPDDYIKKIDIAEAAGIGTLIIDSLSHAWMGKGGVLEIADTAAKRSKSKNSFNAWREATPEHDKLMERIIQSKINIIVTMRSKAEWVIEDVDGKKVPKKLGMAAVQREGTDYIFDVVLDVSDDGTKAIVTKTRYSPLSGKVLSRPGADLGKELAAWLSDGVDVSPVIVSSNNAQRIDNPYATVLREAIEQSENIAGLDNVAVAIKEATPRLAPAEIVSLRNAFAARRKHFVTT